jgi:5-methylcytosine-specific restriction endonuclease McrA
MDAAIRQLVISRAQNRCEYCLLPQSAAPLFTFHIEHIHAQQHVVDDSPGNLALACTDCNRHKGPNLTTLADNTRRITPLFHPRQDRWKVHFEFQGPLIVGRT